MTCEHCGNELPRIPRQFQLTLPLVGYVQILCLDWLTDHVDVCPCEADDPIYWQSDLESAMETAAIEAIEEYERERDWY